MKALDKMTQTQKDDLTSWFEQIERAKTEGRYKFGDKRTKDNKRFSHYQAVWIEEDKWERRMEQARVKSLAYGRMLAAEKRLKMNKTRQLNEKAALEQIGQTDA